MNNASLTEFRVTDMRLYASKDASKPSNNANKPTHIPKNEKEKLSEKQVVEERAEMEIRESILEPNNEMNLWTDR